MTTMRTLLIMSALSLMPWQALAAGDDKAHMDDHGPARSEFMKKVDTDNDGMISKAEFMAASEQRFKEMDTNGDGKASKEEWVAHRDKMRQQFREKRQQHMENKKEKAQ